MICWKIFRAARAYFLKSLLRKMNDTLKKFRAARAYFLHKLLRNMGDICQNFPRCARLFLNNLHTKISDTLKTSPHCAHLFLNYSLRKMDDVFHIFEFSKRQNFRRCWGNSRFWNVEITFACLFRTTSRICSFSREEWASMGTMRKKMATFKRGNSVCSGTTN